MSKQWEAKTLGSLCDFVRGPFGGSLKKSCFKTYGYAVYEQQHAIYDQFLDIRYFIDEPKYREMKRFELFPGDLIMSCSGTMGKVAIVPDGIPKGIINQALLKLSPKKDILAEFLKYWMNSPKFYNELIKLSQGVAIKNVASVKVLKEIQIYLPPVPEQKRIVAILDEAFEGIDRAIANTEKNLANARELFESYLNAIFTQKGEGWVEKNLEDICSIKHGFAFKGEFFTNDPSHYILLTPGSFYESGGYREQGEKTKYYVGEVPDTYILRKGDFLFAMTEQAVGLLGSSLIVPESNRFLHNQRLGLVQLFNGFEWHNDFFFHQFNTQRFRAAVQSSASGVKVRHTSPKKLGSIKVFFPRTNAEQKAVADTLNDLYAETKRLETIYRQKIVALKDFKQSILQKAFTGELTADIPKTVKEKIAA